MNFHFSTFLTHMTTYWTITGLFMVSDYLVDTYNTYNDYKITNEKINWKKYKNMSISVLTKQCCIILPISCIMDKYQLYIHEYGYLSYMSILRLIMIIFLQDVYFYHTHRILHISRLYKYHRKHHEQKIQVVAVGALYSDYFEFIFSSLLSFFIPAFFVQTNYLEYQIWNILATVNILITHSGYKSLSNEHDIHHKKLTCNYGSGIMLCDKFYGTYVEE
tara:strand:+ start:348 stop:1004 length:657 start_codon:yes stop_codon:yes gene_type:complete